MRKASQKQIDYIDAICSKLNIDKPENLSMHNASNFISSNVDAFKKAKIREKMKTKIIHRNNIDEQSEFFARGRRGRGCPWRGRSGSWHSGSLRGDRIV